MSKELTSANHINNDFRIPPNSLHAEQAVLGGLMLNNKYWEDINSIINTNYFYSKQHQILYDTMNKLFQAGKPIDLITLSEELSQQGQLDYIGGFSYISEISLNTPSTANIIAYAEIIKKNAILREIIFVADQISEYAYHPMEKSVEDLIDFAEYNLINIYKKSISYTNLPKNIIDLLYDGLEDIKNISNSNSLITGLNTGYKDLNKITLGLQKSDLIIIAARPSMGKTTLAMNLCENAALLQDKPVLIFSLEMPEGQILKRILSSITRLEHNKIKINNLNSEEWERLTNTFKRLAKRKNIFIDDSSNITPSELRHKAKKIYKENNGLSLIMVDYLQLMKLHINYNNRNLEITEITRSLKALAKELHVPIIAISQLNRYLEQRTDKRPINSDLRESGAIEQDADLIIFIYRDEIYNTNSKMKGMAEIIIGKHRNGPLGRFLLRFNEKYARFDNCYKNDLVENKKIILDKKKLKKTVDTDLTIDKKKLKKTVDTDLTIDKKK